VAIGRYQDVYWFPDGSLAANVQARVFPLESSALATLYTDATGTVLAPNPLSTNGAGVLTVFAEEGEYWIHIDQRSFRVSVGTPYDVDLFETGVGTLSTGLIAGGEITASLTDPRAIVIPETVGYVVDHSSDPFNPTVTRVHVAAQEAVLVGASLTRNVTWWMLDATGAVVQQEPTPTPEQRRTHIVLGVTAYNPGADLIYIVRTQPGILPQTLNQVNDLMDALGPFSLSGNVVTPNAGLTLSKTSGVMFTRGFRYLEDPDNPHESTLAAQNPMQFRYGTRNTTVFPLATTTLVDPANYDVAGVVTPVPGGAGASTIQRVWAFGTPGVPDQMTIQYGQSVYASLSAALERLGQSGYVPNPIFRSLGTVVAYIVTTRTASDLSQAAQAVIVGAGKFPTP
jgi:hypothetical protein